MTGHCPRCGYDQSGEVAVWSDRCPLNGRCTECGLDFDWSHVLNPSLVGPPWSIEHRHDEAEIGVTRFVLTWLLVMWAGRFWRSLEMHHVIHWRQLLRATLIAVLLSYFILTPIALGLRSLQVQACMVSAGTGWTPPVRDPIESICWPISTFHGQIWFSQLFDVAWFAIWFALTPLCFIIFRRTLRTARVRPAHIARITLYGLWRWPVVLVLYSLLIVDAPVLLPSMGWELNWPVAAMDNGYWFLTSAPQVLGALLIAMWFGLFWQRAISRYLKLRHAWLTAIAITIISLLASLIVTGNGADAWTTLARTFWIELA